MCFCKICCRPEPSLIHLLLIHSLLTHLEELFPYWPQGWRGWRFSCSAQFRSQFWESTVQTQPRWYLSASFKNTSDQILPINNTIELNRMACIQMRRKLGVMCILPTHGNKSIFHGISFLVVLWISVIATEDCFNQCCGQSSPSKQNTLLTCSL